MWNGKQFCQLIEGTFCPRRQMPYMKLLGHFKEPWKIKVRDLIIQRVRRTAQSLPAGIASEMR